MREYRIKEKNNAFYPQYKYGYKTMWMWESFREMGTIVYKGTPYEDSWKNRTEYTEWVFFDKTKAEEFIQKKYDKRVEIYHEVIPRVKQTKTKGLEAPKGWYVQEAFQNPLHMLWDVIIINFDDVANNVADPRYCISQEKDSYEEALQDCINQIKK